MRWWPPGPWWRLTTRQPSFQSIRSHGSIVAVLLVLLLALALLPLSSSATAASSSATRPPMRLLALLRCHHQQQHRRSCPALLLTMTTAPGHTLHTAASSATPTPAALRQSVLDGLRRRLKPVQHLDTDARRYARDREAFKGYLLGRFGLASLAAQGEESSVRRAVHARLLQDDPAYRGMVEAELLALEDPWGATKQPFRPLAARITSTSQRDAYLPAARAGLAAVEKALGQLEIGVEKARERAQADPEDAGARATLAEREARWVEMVAKKGRFEALVAVLGRVEERLGEARAEVLARLAARAAAAAAGYGDGGGSGAAVAVPPPRDTTAWGKAVEKEAKAALEAVLSEINEGSSGGGGPPLQLLASVLFKTLDGEEMVGLREEALAEGGARLYASDVVRPKGEIDLLVVRPRPDDAKTLQVVLAVEVKRSLDEVAVDCLKLHLLLDMCARAAAPPPFACGRSRRGGPSSEDGFALDFSLGGSCPAEAAAYLAKRGGATLRAVSKLMLEVVQLAHVRVGEEGNEAPGADEEAERRLRRRLLDFYAPDFVVDADDDGDGGPASVLAEAEAARDGVVDELWERFRTSGADRLEARVGRVALALTGGEGELGEGGLRTVFVLGNSGGGDG